MKRKKGRRTDFRSSAGDRASGERQWLDAKLQPEYPHWKDSLADALRLVGHMGAKRATVGEHTQAKRRAELFLIFETLEDLGFELKDVRQVKGRHVTSLMEYWLKEGHMPATIQCRLSTLRWLAKVIGKEGMVMAVTAYVDDPARVRRTTVAASDRSWSAKNVDSQSIVDDVSKTDARVGVQLAMARAFGLRARESMMFRPHVDDLGAVLHIRHGTKGGRDRVIPVLTPAQRAVVDQTKAFAATKNASLLERGLTLAQGRRRFYYVMEQHGITRKDLGVTAHGLRHERLNDVYEELTGLPSPVRGATVRADKETETYARTVVTEMAGHNRLDVGGAYYGPLRGLPRVDPSHAPVTGHTAACDDVDEKAMGEACKADTASGAPADTQTASSPNNHADSSSNSTSGPPTSVMVGESKSLEDRRRAPTPVPASRRRGSRRRWRPLSAAAQRAALVAKTEHRHPDDVPPPPPPPEGVAP